MRKAASLTVLPGGKTLFYRQKPPGTAKSGHPSYLLIDPEVQNNNFQMRQRYTTVDTFSMRSELFRQNKGPERLLI
ncbi:MAG: hypothetical protein C0507_02365 [Cyanobacteria bacterium PR.3.49]|nr:hypothetical protein [Cyanobacteria bacterium PR.3.49]